MSFGLDFAWSHPSVSAMRQADVAFICRYLSNDPSKDLTRAEAQAANKAGISCVVVWETTANRALSGYEGGKVDAQRAAAKAKAVGMPDSRPIYFAVDFDASSAQQKTIDAYMAGAASVIGKSRVGAYAGYYPLKRCFDNGTITWGWQTYAWSGGKWDSRAHIQQYKNGVNFDGADVDYNRSIKADFGQWKIGEVPDMALSTDDKKWILENVPRAVLTADGIVDNPVSNPENTHVGTKWILTDTNRRVRDVSSAVTALGAAVSRLGLPDVDEAAIAAAVLAGLSPESIAAAVVSSMGPEFAESLLDALRTRLES